MRAVYVFCLNKHSSNYNVGLTKATSRWDDADISENVTSKVDLYFLNPQRNLYCLTSLTLPNVGGLFSSCIPTISNFTKRKKVLRGLFTSSTKCETSRHTATLKKCIKMVCCSAGLLLCKNKAIAFLTFSLSLPSLDLNVLKMSMLSVRYKNQIRMNYTTSQAF